MALGEQFPSVLEAAQAGAEWAMAALYKDLQPSVLVYLRTKEPFEAEDVASEVWLDIAAGLRRFEGDEDAFRRWVFTIARRRLIDLRRQAGRRHTTTMSPETLARREPSGDTEAVVIAAMEAEEAMSMIVSLPPDQAEVVLLRLVAGFSAAEIATIMGKRPGTIRVLQHRALARLAKELARRAVTDRPPIPM
jgi:RNA polymerase sigma-70 factor (ECF subfamily)